MEFWQIAGIVFAGIVVVCIVIFLLVKKIIDGTFKRTERPNYSSLVQFKDVKKYHEELHHHGCDSWQAAEDGNRELALQHFDMALASYRKFYDAIENFKAYLRTIGHVDETPIKPFKN